MRQKRAREWAVARIGGVVAALAGLPSMANAGGFGIHEQSTVFLGSASAGSAAGGSIGSMYWNSAATAELPGLNSESSYTLILPRGDITVTSSPLGSGSGGDIGIDALVSASYGAYQLNKDTWIGISLTAPFGLSTKPDNQNYPGSYLAMTTKLMTMNANPTIAYRIAPGITVGAGVQIEFAQGKLAFRTSPVSTANFIGEDWAFGGTAGIMLEPSAGTKIGLGYRSNLTHDLSGPFSTGVVAFDSIGKVKLPEIVTLSLRHELSSDTRLLATVEWTNWSRFDALTLTPDVIPQLSIPANWSDGWFFSVGGEYDYSQYLTLRGGFAYEMSPVDDPTKRIVSIPDADRYWLSVGASYKYSESTTIDIGYAHLFVDDMDFVRSPVGSPAVFTGSIDASADLVSIGARTKW